MNKLNRRNFLKLIGASATIAAAPSLVRAGTLSSIGHVVVVGGGFAGATVAKYLRLWSRGQIAVTLIDKNPAHVSCILSNLILNGRLGVSDLTLSYTNLTSLHGVTVVQDLVTSVDPSSKTVLTQNSGTLSYDRLVLAPGISFDLPAVENLPAGEDFYALVPHAWIAGEKTRVGSSYQYQTVILKNLLQNMPNGGVVVLTIPKSPYRCPPGPYERACVIADYLKRKKPKSKLIVLDANSSIQAEPETFTKAFSQLYGAILSYVPNASVDKISFRADDKKLIYHSGLPTPIVADVVNVIPAQRAGGIVQSVPGLLDATGRWAMVDPISYASTALGYESIYVIGDACTTPTATINGKTVGKLPKSGHMANSQAKTCADAIVREMVGSLPVDDLARLSNLTNNSACYSPITYDQASWLTAVYRYNLDYRVMELADYTSSEGAAGIAFGEAGAWNKENFEEMFKWANSLFADSFA
jgi:NADPH-dependent 2,4-dienoyl-CoA reductase/sulfur reductase-like enzyme